MAPIFETSETNRVTSRGFPSPPANEASARAGEAGDPCAFALSLPDADELPLIMSSPHSGRLVPGEIARKLALPADKLRSLEDGPVDRLIEPCAARGVAILKAVFARTVVDLNRDADELDPQLVAGAIAGMALRSSVKARAGLGVVPTRVSSVSLYPERLAAGDVIHRIDTAWRPYHAEIARLMADRHERFGTAVLLDCHSMPRESLGAGARVPVDIALGDRFGRTCHPSIMALVESHFLDAGLTVARNQPYAGGYITQAYGRPRLDKHALQIEVRRDLFMDERTGEVAAGFEQLRAVFEGLPERFEAWLGKQDFSSAA